MKKRYILLNLIFMFIILLTFLLLDLSLSKTINVIALVFIMLIYIVISTVYLDKVWFKHIDELDLLIHDMKNDQKVEVFELSKDNSIENLQYGIEELSEHIESMATKYGYRKGQLEAILASLNTGLVAITPDGTVIFNNPKFTEIYRLSQNIQGKNIFENIFDVHLLNVIDSAVSESLFILPNIIQPNGLVYDFKGLEITSRGDRIGTLIMVEDVTKVHKVDKMKSDFVSNVTHELKTPLTSIRGFTETLMNVSPEDIETRNKFLDIIEKESERLSVLINDILYLSEVESTVTTVKDDVDINRIISEVIELSRHNLKEQVKIEIDAEKNYIVKFEQFKLKQLLLNLVSNSVKYTDEGSITISVNEDGEYVILKVSDTGIGIPEKDQGRIFERFYRVDKGRSRLTGGTGLGLSIVKHIVERNDCQIHLDSTLGEGTVVTLLIKK